MKIVKEGINDKNLFKAVFLAGGPGSGKSFIADSMFLSSSGISPFGVKVINSDKFFELGLEKADLSKVVDISDTEVYQKQMTIRRDAKLKTNIQQGFFIDGMLPLIIDGTGKDFNRISRQAKDLYDIGYDVSMVFINTSLDVALERNNQRERKVDPSLVVKMWNEVQANTGKFQSFFGNNDFIIDNNTYLEPGSKESEDFLNHLFRVGRGIIESPLKNYFGIRIIQKLRATGGKYLSDLMESDDKLFHERIVIIREKGMKTIEIQEDVKIVQEDKIIILEKGDRIRIILEQTEKAPWDISEIGVKKGEPIVVSDDYQDTAGDFRIKVCNGDKSRSTWLIFGSRKEAIADGWRV